MPTDVEFGLDLLSGRVAKAPTSVIDQSPHTHEDLETILDTVGSSSDAIEWTVPVYPMVRG